MTGEVEVTPTPTWNGGASPYGVGHKKLGMWLFLISDSLTFGSLLISCMYARTASTNWPTPFPMWPSIAFATLMTFCLLTSSLTMAFAVDASKRGDRAAVVRNILFTMLGGIAFIVLHAREWLHLIGEGVRPWHNPWGAPLFGASFFGLTGLHMFHVFSGVIYLGIIALGTRSGRRTHEDIEICGLYWHFVDLVWMFIFPLIYLMSVAPK
ncbi:MAG TPA: cytochrome c oxidase subunit 3 [Bryobacteraceae bacterium]|nr:cytochrome c oxidase subunit 3 [Bryobacteraceae bacterium]